MQHKRSLLLIFAVLAVLIMASCSKTQSSQTPTTSTPTAAPITTPISTTPPVTVSNGPQGELRIAVTGVGNENFIPRLSTVTTTGDLLCPMFDMLFYAVNGKVAPGVVEKWEMQPDGLSYLFYIQKGIKFHNGQQLTAQDVKFSIEQYMAKDSYVAYVRNMVDHVEIIDDYTARVFTKGKQPYLPFFMSTQDGAMQGTVQPKTYFENNSEAYFQSHPIGSGPFKLVNHYQGDVCEYEAFDDYWQQKAAFKRLTIILMPEESTRIACLKTGTVDVTEFGLENSRDLESQGWKDRLFAGPPQIPNIQFHGAFDSRGAGMPISDIRVRQALSLAVNREEIGSTIFLGKSEPPMPACLYEGTPDIDVPYWQEYATKLYRYDPVEAKRLLKEAGYSDGFKLKLYTFTPSGSSYLPALGEVVQAYWRDIGVIAEITPITDSVYYSWRKGTADPLVGQAVMYRQLANFPLSNLTSAYGSAGANQIVGKAMPELDSLITAGLSETDDVKRVDIIARAIKMATDTFVCVGVGTIPPMGGFGSRVNMNFSYSLPHFYLGGYAYLASHTGK